ATRRRKKHFICKAQEFYRKMFPVNSHLPSIDGHNLQSYLQMIIKYKEIRPSAIYKEVGVCVVGWLNGHIPTKTSSKKLCKLSEFLELGHHFLLDTFFPKIHTHTCRFTEPSDDDFIEKTKRLSSSRYCISNEQWKSDPIIETIRQEYLKYYKYKTRAVPEHKKLRRKKSKWMVRSNGICSSSDFAIRYLRPFFGYIHNIDKGEKELSLQDVLNHEMVSDFIDFFTERQGGIVTKSVMGFYNTFIYIAKYYQQYFERVTVPITKEELDELIEDYSIVRSDLEFEAVRDVERNIAPLLKLEDPLVPIFEMIENMKIDYWKLALRGDSLELHTLCRNIVLLMLVLRKPLRPMNWSDCKISKNLVCKDEVWSIKYLKGETKNKKMIQKEFGKEESSWIDLYLSKHRGYFLKGGSLDELFLLSSGKKMLSVYLTREMRKVTKIYLGRSLSMYDYRHLRATAYLMKYPGDFDGAAELLNDDWMTVKKHYSHLDAKLVGKKDDDEFDQAYFN
ncbi:MAG: hypothetical protein KAG61_09435, partial [Bacteriovoracaceae bacterium]|nr:hypothetical protein [Bacteriovoracaceae bacterium]